MECEDRQTNYVRKAALSNRLVEQTTLSRFNLRTCQRGHLLLQVLYTCIGNESYVAAHHTVEITRALRQYRACVE